jgi:hypothetical protein
VVSGSFLLAAIAYRLRTSVTAPSGWTLVHKQQSANCTLEIYRRTAGASEPTSYTWTFPGAATSYGLIRAFDGTTVSGVDVFAGQSNSNAEIVEYFSGWTNGRLVTGLSNGDEFAGWSAGRLAAGYSPLITGATLEIAVGDGVDPTSNAGYLMLLAALASNARATPPAGMSEVFDSAISAGGVYTGLYAASQQLTSGNPTGERSATLASGAANEAVLVALMPVVTGYDGGAGNLAPGATIYADSVILDYGVDGNGWYEVNAIDGLYGANSPYMQILDWTEHPATGANLRVRIGNLNGMAGFAGLWGAYFRGADEDQYISITQDGIDLRNANIELWDGADLFVKISLEYGLDIGSYTGTNPNPTENLKSITFWHDVSDAGSTTIRPVARIWGIDDVLGQWGIQMDAFRPGTPSNYSYPKFWLLDDPSFGRQAALIDLDQIILGAPRIDALGSISGFGWLTLERNGTLGDPATPSSGKVVLYIDASGNLKAKGSGGTVTTLASA